MSPELLEIERKAIRLPIKEKRRLVSYSNHYLRDINRKEMKKVF
jgi:hypothetical protein